MARMIEMNEREIVECVEAIRQWCEDSDCDTCCFYKNQMCCLCDFPVEWDFPKVKTFSDVLLEKFPKASCDYYGTPYFCVKCAFGQDGVECEFVSFEEHSNNRDVCNRCWKKTAPEEYQK